MNLDIECHCGSNFFYILFTPKLKKYILYYIPLANTDKAFIKGFCFEKVALSRSKKYLLVAVLYLFIFWYFLGPGK